MKANEMTIVLISFVALAVAAVSFGQSAATADPPKPSQKHKAEKSAELERTQNLDLHLHEFGTTRGQPVDQGFVFFDGQYIEAPYIVARKGLAIFVNETMLDPPNVKWPPPQPNPEYGAFDPELPASISRNTISWDSELIDYIRAKNAYIVTNRDAQDIPHLKLALYKTLPNVNGAEFDNATHPTLITVTWSDGRVDNILIHPPTRKPITLDRDAILERLNENRQNYEDNLKSGSGYLLFSKSGRIAIGSASARTKLPRLIEILRSEKTDEEKFAELHKAGWVGITPTTCAKLVTNFSASPQLEQRLDEAIHRHTEEIRKKRQSTKEDE